VSSITTPNNPFRSLKIKWPKAKRHALEHCNVQLKQNIICKKNRSCRCWWTLAVSSLTPIKNPFLIIILCHHIYLLCFSVWFVNKVVLILKKIYKWLHGKNVRNIETLTRYYNFSWIINIYGISIYTVYVKYNIICLNARV